MELNDPFIADNNQSNSSETSKTTTPIPKAKPDDKVTLEQEADLTVLEIEEMEKEHSEKSYKGSSGPEEKDISA